MRAWKNVIPIPRFVRANNYAPYFCAVRPVQGRRTDRVGKKRVLHRPELLHATRKPGRIIKRKQKARTTKLLRDDRLKMSHAGGFRVEPLRRLIGPVRVSRERADVHAPRDCSAGEPGEWLDRQFGGGAGVRRVLGTGEVVPERRSAAEGTTRGRPANRLPTPIVGRRMEFFVDRIPRRHRRRSRNV